MRRLPALAAFLMLASQAAAGGAEDLAAAQAAGLQGVRDEAIRLYTKAIGGTDLAPAERAAALRGRGGEYAAKSLIADAFDKRDDAVRQRDNALADFDAAVKLNAGDADLYAARGQVEHMAGKFDAAIADFDAAFKLKASAITLAQRGASKRAKVDYDGAGADYAAALALQPKDAAIEDTDLVTERGYTNFLAGRFEAAAADFSQAMTMGMAERATDVLWLPYQTAWLHLARLRSGKDDAQELKSNASRVDLAQWPGTVIAWFLGDLPLDKISTGSSHGMSGRGRECSLSFFAGEQMLGKGDKAAALPMLKRGKDVCNPHTIYSLAASVELARAEK